MRHCLDVQAVDEAFMSAGHDDGRDAMVNLFVKAEADPSGTILGCRHTMMNDYDIAHTRMARAVVGAAVASVVRDPMIYVSGGAEHQGPSGGGPIAVICRKHSIV
jgi:cyanuric acid amidohydrolase